MAVRVQVPPSAPYQRGAMTLSCCSLFSFCLPHPVKSVFLVSFWYQDVLDVQKLVEQANGYLFTADYFAEVCNPNRLFHIAGEAGLRVVNLNTLSGKSRARATGFSEAECKRLSIGVLIVADRNGWAQDTFLLREVRGPCNRQASLESMEFITDWFESASNRTTRISR